MATMRRDNRKAHFEIAVEKTYEAGLILTGDEIKSIRADRVQLTGSYVKVMGSGALVVIGMHLGLAKEPDRSRKLLLKQEEIDEIKKALQTKGKAAVPLNLHLRRGWAKLEIGVGAGRRAYDKRELLKRRDTEREQQRELKRY